LSGQHVQGALSVDILIVCMEFAGSLKAAHEGGVLGIVLFGKVGAIGHQSGLKGRCFVKGQTGQRFTAGVHSAVVSASTVAGTVLVDWATAAASASAAIVAAHLPGTVGDAGS